jgi:hypothetical protein
MARLSDASDPNDPSPTAPQTPWDPQPQQWEEPQQPQPQQWQQPPAAPYPAPYAGGQPMAINPFDSETTVVLVFGILSLVTCGLLGIVAWVQGNSLKKRAEAAGWPEPSTGKVGRILGIVGTCIGVFQLLFIAAYAVFFIAVAAGSSM